MSTLHEGGSVLEEVSTATAGSDGRTKPDSKLVSFSDVARAHYRWDVAAKGTDRENARQEFNAKLAEFEHRFKVEVIEAYWCRKEASAIALAEARPQRPGPLRRFAQRVSRRQEAPDFRLYRVTDWVTGDVRKLADLLHECDVLAIKATWALEGFQRTVVMQWLLAVETHILGFVESEWKRAPVPGDAPETQATDGLSPADVSREERTTAKMREQAKKRAQQEAAARLDRLYLRTLRELSKIEDYYHQAGQKRARLRYVEGMLLFGVLAVAFAAVLSGVILEIFGLLDLERAGVRRFYASMAAGAVGAIISVLMRMSGGGFAIDHELGSVGIRRLGAFRPLIGAVSGVVLVLLLQTSLVPIDQDTTSMAFYVVVGFLAGFSERWTRVVLEGAMRTIDKVDDG